jgi:hypothetical protein
MILRHYLCALPTFSQPMSGHLIVVRFRESDGFILARGAIQRLSRFQRSYQPAGVNNFACLRQPLVDVAPVPPFVGADGDCLQGGWSGPVRKSPLEVLCQMPPIGYQFDHLRCVPCCARKAFGAPVDSKIYYVG